MFEREREGGRRAGQGETGQHRTLYPMYCTVLYCTHCLGSIHRYQRLHAPSTPDRIGICCEREASACQSKGIRHRLGKSKRLQTCSAVVVHCHDTWYCKAFAAPSSSMGSERHGVLNRLCRPNPHARHAWPCALRATCQFVHCCTVEYLIFCFVFVFVFPCRTLPNNWCTHRTFGKDGILLLRQESSPPKPFLPH